MSEGEIIFAYKGDINRELLKNIIKMADNKMEVFDENRMVRKRVGSILIECLENIINYSENSGEHPAILIIKRLADGYSIQVGNIVKQGIVTVIRDKIDKINGMDNAQLKQYYQQVLTEQGFGEKGGAGLGFIDIAKKAKDNKIWYDFRTINPEYCFFTSRVLVQGAAAKA